MQRKNLVRLVRYPLTYQDAWMEGLGSKKTVPGRVTFESDSVHYYGLKFSQPGSQLHILNGKLEKDRYEISGSLHILYSCAYSTYVDRACNFMSVCMYMYVCV